MLFTLLVTIITTATPQPVDSQESETKERFVKKVCINTKTPEECAMRSEILKDLGSGGKVDAEEACMRLKNGSEDRSRAQGLSFALMLVRERKFRAIACETLAVESIGFILDPEERMVAAGEIAILVTLKSSKDELIKQASSAYESLPKKRFGHRLWLTQLSADVGRDWKPGMRIAEQEVRNTKEPALRALQLLKLAELKWYLGSSDAGRYYEEANTVLSEHVSDAFFLDTAKYMLEEEYDDGFSQEPTRALMNKRVNTMTDTDARTASKAKLEQILNSIPKTSRPKRMPLAFLRLHYEN